ncbi:uronyl 2-sulfotransferase-like [Styela clava]
MSPLTSDQPMLNEGKSGRCSRKHSSPPENNSCSSAFERPLNLNIVFVIKYYLEIMKPVVRYSAILVISVSLFLVSFVYWTAHNSILSTDYRHSKNLTTLDQYFSSTQNTTNEAITATAVSTVTPTTTRTSITGNDATPEFPVDKIKNVFYNRVGKCGSRSLINLVRVLKILNKFNESHSNDYANDHPNRTEVETEMKKIAHLKPPSFYNRHIHFIDFEKHGIEQPIYINMIRDPIQRFSSQYNYMKYGDAIGKVSHPEHDLPDINDCVMQNISLCNNTMFMFYTGLYFCGFEDICLHESRGRVELAKKHIDEKYLAIGLTEEFEDTLKLFETMLPSYFRSAFKIWEQKSKLWQKRTTTKRREILTEASIDKLKNSLLLDEYEVYNHGRKKFERLKKKYGIQ